MKSILKIIFSISILSFYSSANADTIKWLHLFGDDDLSMPKMLQAVKEFEDKTGHTVELQYLEMNLLKRNFQQCFNQMIDLISFIVGVVGLCMIKQKLVS